MKQVIIIILVLISVKSFSQLANDTTLDVLKAPSSPGATLLGFSPSEIDKPTDVSALMLNIQTNSSNFTKIPSKYAIDFAPYWLLSKKSSYTTKELGSTKFNETFKQTFLISISFLTPDSSYQFFKKGNSYLGLGFKATLVRGKYSNEAQKTLNEISDLQINHISDLSNMISKKVDNNEDLKKINYKRKILAKKLSDNNIDPDTDSTYIKLKQEYNDKKNEILQTADTAEIITKYSKDLKSKAANLILKRTGWNWDVAGGISGEFVDKRFDSSYVHNAGFWSNLSYTSANTNNTFLLLIRYLYQPNKTTLSKLDTVSQNINTYDAGLRYVYSTKDNKFNAGLEAIYRSYRNKITAEDTWKLVFTADYSIYKNQKLSFSFGKDFDGIITKSGNLIAALTFIQGLGNRR